MKYHFKEFGIEFSEGQGLTIEQKKILIKKLMLVYRRLVEDFRENIDPDVIKNYPFISRREREMLGNIGKFYTGKKKFLIEKEINDNADRWEILGLISYEDGIMKRTRLGQAMSDREVRLGYGIDVDFGDLRYKWDIRDIRVMLYILDKLGVKPYEKL